MRAAPLVSAGYQRLALHGLQPCLAAHGFFAAHGFLAAHGLHGLHGLEALAEHGLQPFLAEHGLQAAIWTGALAEFPAAAAGRAVVAAARAATLSTVTVVFNMISLTKRIHQPPQDSGLWRRHESRDPHRLSNYRDMQERTRAFLAPAESHRPAPPPGHPRDGTLWVAGWGSGPVPSKPKTLSPAGRANGPATAYGR